MPHALSNGLLSGSAFPFSKAQPRRNCPLLWITDIKLTFTLPI